MITLIFISKFFEIAVFEIFTGYSLYRDSNLFFIQSILFLKLLLNKQTETQLSANNEGSCSVYLIEHLTHQLRTIISIIKSAVMDLRCNPFY